MELKDIKAIIDLMRKNSISEFELEKNDFKIRLKRGANGSGLPSVTLNEVPMPTLPQSLAGSVLLPSGSSPSTAASSELEIKSPMVGTFYRAPSPESGNYVDIGSEVNPETVVCIIEAMKVMNEIKAEVKGLVSHVLVDNAKPVEFGQPLFKIRPT